VMVLRLVLVGSLRRMVILLRFWVSVRRFSGTAWYQLNHASVKKDVVRFHVCTWFGVCSYRKLKVTVEVKKDLCPICQHDLIWIRYFGDRSFVLDGNSSDYRRDSFEDYEEDGRVVWFERVKHEYR